MGKPRNTRKYPTYPEIPEIPGNTRKKKRYPEIPDRIFRHSYPTRTRPATRYFVQYPTRPDPILKNPTRWALDCPCPREIGTMRGNLTHINEEKNIFPLDFLNQNTFNCVWCNERGMICKCHSFGVTIN